MRPAAAAPSRGAQLSTVRRPPAAPSAAEHPPGQAGAGHHGIRAGAGLGPAENDELAATRWRTDGLLSPAGHTRHRRSPARSLSQTGTGASHRRRRGAVRIDRAPEVVPVTPAALRGTGPGTSTGAGS